MIETSPGAQKAKKMGLKSKGFGNWVDPKSGKRFTSKGGQLKPVKTKPQPDDVGGPAHPNVPKKKPKDLDPEKPKGEPSDMDTEKPTDDVGGPAYPNVPKGSKSSTDAKKFSKDIKDMSDNERQKYFNTVTTDTSAVKGPKPDGDWTVSEWTIIYRVH